MRSLFLFTFILALTGTAAAQNADCGSVPSYSELKAKLTAARADKNGGLNTDMWGVVVNRDGVICAIAFTGADRGAQWPGSRIIAAQKAYAANAFSLPGLSVSTANLFSATQPGGTLFGLGLSNTLETKTAYSGDAANFGQQNDPLVGQRIGGLIVFGGGVALYNKDHKLVGALGVSGDTSCADHNIAWRARHGLGLDFVPAGVSPQKDKPDNIVYDIAKLTGSSGGWGHPSCSKDVVKIAETLPAVSK